MARTRRPIEDELDPDTPRGRLYADVAGAYPRSLTPFFDAVANAVATTRASEKGTFYRYLRGKPLPADRLDVYAAVLGRSVVNGWREEQTTTPRAATLADLAVRMDEALQNQRDLWGELRRLSDAVHGVSADLGGLVTAQASLVEFLRSVLEPPNSARGRR